MKLIDIQNFRCFRQLKVSFTPGVNLFIGDNASGKTSLLTAAKYAINSFFSGFSDIYTTWPAPRKDDFTRYAYGEKRLSPMPINIGFSFFSDEIHGDSFQQLADKEQILIIKNEKNPRPLLAPLGLLRQYGSFLFDNQISKAQDGIFFQSFPLPLIASFSTHGIHNKPKIISRYFSEIEQTPSFGYYLCSSTDGLLDHWIRRLLVLKEFDKNDVERSIVLDALYDMFGPQGCNVMCDFHLGVNYKDVICYFNDGRETPVAVLSDGYKRLFSIVIDLAFRCALLNSLIYGRKAARMTQGTVIIDEIDLHLHPSLQSVVLKALQNTFPKLQFLVSTHAPMVMTGVENSGRNCVQYLTYDAETKDYSSSTVETFGMDLSTLAETVLNVPKREASVEIELAKLMDFVDDEDYVSASALLKSMKERFGSRIPELTGIETQITIEEALNND